MNDDLIDIVMNIHKFNQDLTSLNIKYSETIEKQLNEIERLHSIIKEVRDYIERRDIDWGSEEHDHVLEILDKENEKWKNWFIN